MKLKLSDLWRWDGEMGRGAYLFWGLLLAVVKYNLDRLIAVVWFGQHWSVFQWQTVRLYLWQSPWSEIERRFRALRWQDPPAIDAWRKDLERVRKRGYAIDRGNYISGVIVLAVPVFNARKEITHTLVAAGLADQLDNARCATIAKDMQAEADQLAAVLFARA